MLRNKADAWFTSNVFLFFHSEIAYVLIKNNRIRTFCVVIVLKYIFKYFRVFCESSQSG